MTKKPISNTAEEDAVEVETAVIDDVTTDPARDPVSPPVEPTPAPISDIPAGEPYPTGGERDTEADFEQAHGYRRS